MLHITYPELFASTIWKEVFNFLWRDATFDNEKNKNLKFFRTPDFVSNLKFQIHIDSHFRRTDIVHLKFLDLVNEEYINSLIADMLAFFYGYAGDYELFSYWYWRVLLQSSLYYDKSGKLDPGIFISFLGRILFIKILAYTVSLDRNDSSQKGAIEEAEQVRMCPADPALSELWHSNFDGVWSFVKILYRILERNNFRQIFLLMASRFMKNKLIDKWVSEIDHDVAGTKERAEKNPLFYIQFRNTIIRKYRQEYFASFNAGYLISFEGKNERSIFLCALFQAFLEYLKILDYPDVVGKSQMLQRDEAGKPMLREFKNCYSRILVDPLGGMFCIDHAVQGKYFGARALFFRTIFDYCMKNKTDLLN